MSRSDTLAAADGASEEGRLGHEAIGAGLRNTGPDSTGMSSPARSGSVLVAPTKVRDWVATKKKFSIPGGARRPASAPAFAPAPAPAPAPFAGRAAPLGRGARPPAPAPAPASAPARAPAGSPAPRSRLVDQCGRTAPSTSRADPGGGLQVVAGRREDDAEDEVAVPLREVLELGEKAPGREARRAADDDDDEHGGGARTGHEAGIADEGAGEPRAAASIPGRRRPPRPAPGVESSRLPRAGITVTATSSDSRTATEIATAMSPERAVRPRASGPGWG